MQTPRSNVGAWVKAGRSASKSVLDNFEVARAYSPDYTGMAVQGMKARTEEKVAAMKADARVDAAQIEGKAKIAQTEMKVDAFKAKNKAKGQIAKGSAFAKAGALLGAGLAKDDTPPPTDYSALHDLYKKRGAELEADEASFTPFQRTIDPDTKKPIGGNTRMAGILPAAGGAADNIQPAADQQTAGITTSSNVKPNTPTAGATMSTPDISSGPLNAQSIAAMAQASGAKYPKLVAAQWALESGWGKTPSGKNNFFGIKATAGESGTNKQTWEVRNGQETTETAKFKNFATPQAGVDELVNRWYKDYGSYSGVNRAGSAAEAADLLRHEGYALDPAYSQKLKDIMSRFDF